jgi:hypothetical protein
VAGEETAAFAVHAFEEGDGGVEVVVDFEVPRWRGGQTSADRGSWLKR